MIRLSLLILCISYTVGQRKGNRYVRLPSGYTFAEPSSSLSRFAKFEGSHYGFDKVRESTGKYQIGPAAAVSPEYNSAPQPPPLPPPPYQASPSPAASPSPSEGGQVSTSAPNYVAETTAAPVLIEGAGAQPQKEKKPALTKAETGKFITNLHVKNGHLSEADRHRSLGHTFTTLGGGQFYQSLFGGKNGFSPLSFFLGGGRSSNSPFLIPVPIVVPPPPPPPPGPKCYTNPSGFLCCNVTLERTMEEAYIEAKAEGISSCNVQRMATAVQEAVEKKFSMPFESIVGHKDFVAKVNFAGDLNCKIEVDGKFFLAYATPTNEEEVNIIDANSFFAGDADEILENHNGTDGKPTYIVYGPIR